MGAAALELPRLESRAEGSTPRPTVPSSSDPHSRASGACGEAALGLEEITKPHTPEPRQKGGWTPATSHPSHTHLCHSTWTRPGLGLCLPLSE